MSQFQRILIIGAGPVGRDAIRVLDRMPTPPSVVVGDRDGERAESAASEAALAPIDAITLDASSVRAVADAAAGVDVVLHLGVPECNEAVMAGALQAGAHYIDAAGNGPEDHAPNDLDQQFRDAGLTALGSCGNSPGLTNILAMRLAEDLAKVDSVDIWTAFRMGSEIDGDDQGIRPYRSLFSTGLELSGYASPVRAFIDGAPATLAPFSGIVEHEFPRPHGSMLMVPHEHEEPWSLPEHLGRGVQRVAYYFPVRPEAATLVLSGLASSTPIQVGDVEVSPLDVVTAAVGPSLSEQAAGMAANGGGPPALDFWMEIEVRGADDHGPVRRSAVWTLQSWAADRDEAERVRREVGVVTPTAGFCAVVGACIVASGALPAGLVTPEVISPDTFFAQMAELGLPMRYRLSAEHQVVVG